MMNLGKKVVELSHTQQQVARFRMSTTASQRPPRLLFLSLLISLLFVFGAASFNNYFHTPLLELGDAAINALQVDDAKHFSELYGNYSRFAFNHPGPAFFYVYAGGEWLLYDLLKLTPSPGNAQLLTSMAVQSFFFALALTILSFHVPWRAVLPLALLAAAIHFGRLEKPFVSIWPPHVLLMPFLCFLVACISVAVGHLRHLPFVVLAGGFLFHGHVAQPLFVGTLGALTLVFYVRHELFRAENKGTWRDLLRKDRRVLGFSAALIGIFLLPLIIDVIKLRLQSNVATIIGRFYANTDESKPPLQSFLYFLSFATDARDQDEVFTIIGPVTKQFFREHSLRIALWASVFLIPGISVFIARKRVEPGRGRFLTTAYLFLAVTVALCILWGMAQAEKMHDFNGYFYYGIYYFALILCLIVILPRSLALTTSPALVAICAIAAVLATTLSRIPRTSTEERGVPIQQGTEEALKTDSSTAPKLLVFEHTNWPAIGGLALVLQRHKTSFYTSPWWEFMFQQRHDMTQLGSKPERKVSVWWITKPGPGGIPLSPNLSVFTKPAPLNPNGGEIRLQGGDNGFRYLVFGLTVGIIDYAFTDMASTLFRFAPEHADHDVRITFDAESAKRTKDGLQDVPADIYFNDQLLGRAIVREHSAVSVTVPSTLWNTQPLADLEIRFPASIPRHKYNRPRFELWSGWGLWKIRCDYQP